VESALLNHKNKQLEESITQLNKDYGYELSDPNGTIWQECARLQAENKQLLEQINTIEDDSKK
jgi:cell division protein FtsB